MASVQRQTLNIANGAQPTTEAFTASNFAAFGLQMPAAFTGTSITFQVSADDGATYQALYDATGTAQVSVAVAASRSYDLPAELAAWDHFKIVSGSAEGAARALIVIGKRS